MKKVGIMSMQRIKNYGSFLQAYGLKSIIEELGNKVEFVDYHIEEPLIKDKKTKENKINKVIDVMSYKAKFKHKIQYIKHKKNFSKFFSMLGMSEKYNYCPKVDTLIIGSDEVFNCIQKNPNVGYSLELFGKNSNAKRLITYAASFGNTTLEKINKYKKKQELGGLLGKFDAISVRDKNSGSIVEQLTDIKPVYNLDPVLAYDYMNKCDKIPNLNIDERYIIVYAYNGRISSEESKYIREYARRLNCKIYSIGGAQECADKFIDCNPFEVLAYFKNAELIITDTFHGSIFSIITNKNFVTLVRKSVENSYGNEEKLTDLLNKLDLNSRIIYKIDDIEKIIDLDINYKAVNEIIKNERIKAVNYLRKEI